MGNKKKHFLRLKYLLIKREYKGTYLPIELEMP